MVANFRPDTTALIDAVVGNEISPTLLLASRWIRRADDGLLHHQPILLSVSSQQPAMPLRSSFAAGDALVVVAVASLSTLAIVLIHWGDWLQSRLPNYWLEPGVFTVAGLIGWSIAITHPAWVPARLSAAAALLATASLLSSLAGARPDLSMAATWDLAMKGGTALAFCAAARWPVGRRILIASAAVVLVAVMGSYLIAVGRQWLSWVALGLPWQSLPLRPGGTGGLAAIPPVMADDTLLLAPLVSVAAFQVHRYGRALSALVLLTATACVVISGTRSLWLIAAGALVPVGIWLLRSRGWAKMAGLVAASIVLVLLLAVAVGLPSRVSRDLDEGRTSAFGTAFVMVGRAPILGTGPATYPAERLSDVIPVFEHYAFPNAHDLVLTTMGETGLIGLAALFGATFLVGGQVMRTWRRSSTSRVFVVAPLAGAAIVLGHALVDVVIENPGVLFLLFMVGALGLIPSPEDGVGRAQAPLGRLDNSMITRGAGIIAFAVLIAVAPTTLAVQQSILSRVAAQAAATSNPVGALGLAQHSVDLQSDSGSAIDQVMVLADAIGNSQAAIAAAHRLVQLEGLAQHQIELAILLDRAGQHDAAVLAARMALARDAVDPFVQLNGTVLLAAAGDEESATAALARLIVAQPWIGLQSAAFPPAVGKLLPAATSRAVTMLEVAGRWSDALDAALAGDSNLADAAIQAAPAEQRASEGRLRDAWLGNDAALTALEASLRIDPNDPTMIKGAWLLEERRCGTSAAAKWAHVLRILDGEPVGIPVLLGAGLRRTGMRPPFYPVVLYPVAAPATQYVIGTWTYALGEPACVVR